MGHLGHQVKTFIWRVNPVSEVRASARATLAIWPSLTVGLLTHASTKAGSLTVRLLTRIQLTALRQHLILAILIFRDKS